MLTAGTRNARVAAGARGAAGAAPCDHPRTMRPSGDSGLQALRAEFGLVRPAHPAGRGVPDAHLIAALLAAVPVCLLLGATVGMRMQVPASAAAWLSFVLLQPALEELAFRGVLQGGLRRLGAARRAGPVTLANIGTTAAFVAWHLVAQSPAWALAVALPSLVFGHLRDRTGSVLPSMLVHIVYNAGFGLTGWWVQR
jgi:uncharacterized protein